MKKYIIAVIYAFLLALFTLYTVLDTFVLKDVPEVTIPQSQPNRITPTVTPVTTADAGNEKVDPDIENGEGKSEENGAAVTQIPSASPTPTPTVAPTYTENGYYDGHMNVTITKYREYDSDIYVVDAVIDSVDLLKTKLANAVRAKSEWEFTSDI